MSKQITVSDKVWEQIKNVVLGNSKEEVKKYTKEDLISLLKRSVTEFNKVVASKNDGGQWEELSKVNEKLDLFNTNLSDADLYNADLTNADLTNTDLIDADLTNANLTNTDLFNANLTNADLSNANLSNANLHNANLTNADLTNTDLYNAKFYGKDGTQKLKKSQVETFLKALGFVVEE